jgi:plastocyanin
MDWGLRLLLLLLHLLAGIGSANAAFADQPEWSIHGRVVVPGVASQGSATSGRYLGQAASLSVTGTVERGAVTDAVVYVETLPANFVVENPVGRVPGLEQKDQTFVPRVLAIQSGTTVEFPNRDPVYHNVFSVSPAKRFDLGKYVKGQSRSVRFDKSGLVQVFCDIHSDMAAFILVIPHHVFVRPGADGRFALPELPGGTYRVRAWHPDFGERERLITLAPDAPPDQAPPPLEFRF